MGPLYFRPTLILRLGTPLMFAPLFATDPAFARLRSACIAILLALTLWATGSRRAALVLGVLLVVEPVAQHELKLIVGRARPPFDPDVVWSEPTSPSYPSGHVMSATVVYGWLLYCALDTPRHGAWRWTAGALAATALVMTAVTSFYLAVHWPSDVLGGYLWGLTLLLPAVWFVRLKPTTVDHT